MSDGPSRRNEPKMRCWRVLLASVFFLALMAIQAHARDDFFENSYDIVIGIGNYTNKHWQTLAHAKKDGIAIADFLVGQGYRVYDLYDEEATRTNIMTIIGEEIAPRLTEHHRVVVFFLGHGTTMTIDTVKLPVKRYSQDDGTTNYGTWISMTEMREASRQMTAARHQLFIFDFALLGASLQRKGLFLGDQRGLSSLCREDIQ